MEKDTVSAPRSDEHYVRQLSVPVKEVEGALSSPQSEQCMAEQKEGSLQCTENVPAFTFPQTEKALRTYSSPQQLQIAWNTAFCFYIRTNKYLIFNLIYIISPLSNIQRSIHSRITAKAVFRDYCICRAFTYSQEALSTGTSPFESVLSNNYRLCIKAGSSKMHVFIKKGPF